MQQRLVAVLDTGLAGLRGAGVARRVEFFEVRGGQSPHVTDSMSNVLALRIVAYQPRPEVDSRKTWPLNRESCDLLVVEPRVERHRLETRTAFAEILDALNIARIDEFQRCQPLQGRVDIGHLLRDQFELVGGQVFRERAALAVEHQAADGRYRLNPDTVAEGAFREMLVIEDLQLDEPGND